MNRLLFYAAAAKQQGLQPLLTTFQHNYLEMSFLRRIIWHSRALIRYHLEFYGKRVRPDLAKIEPHVISTGGPTPNTSKNLFGFGTASSPLQWLGQELQSGVRKLFVDNVLRRVTSSLSGELRKKASQRLLYGNDARPFFALVGVSLASGSGMLTKENEFEGICWEIRESLEKKKPVFPQMNVEPLPAEENTEVSVNDLNFGPVLSKGSCAAVYAANWKNEPEPEASGSTITQRHQQYPLAVKMMFNYDFESNSTAIIRAMCKEIVPSRSIPTLRGIQIDDLTNLQFCPPHPNIIDVSHVFADQIPMLPESMELFPAALPRRLNEDGYGRNMSLFLVMKCYDTNLENYIRTHPDLKLKTRLLLLTQLLEGIAHLSRNGIAHRDLKMDNLLLDTTTDLDYPHLTITDFGCCLADKTNGLHLPFPSYETDRGGNAALMAPEVASARPGAWKKISYEKSDAWAAGTLAYELFGKANPFVRESGSAAGATHLDSRTYKDGELPSYTDIPIRVQVLIHELLRRNPNERLSAEMAATICQLYLWCPTNWLLKSGDRVSDSGIMQWLLTLTTKVLCQAPEDTRLEFSVIRVFLRRLKFFTVRLALDWIHTRVPAPVPAPVPVLAEVNINV